MNKYVLRMKTISDSKTEYLYVYANDKFERYLNDHNLKYARDITEDYHLISFINLHQERKELKERINKAIEELEKSQKGLEEWHFDGYDPCLEHIIKILRGEDNE